MVHCPMATLATCPGTKFARGMHTRPCFVGKRKAVDIATYSAVHYGRTPHVTREFRQSGVYDRHQIACDLWIYNIIRDILVHTVVDWDCEKVLDKSACCPVLLTVTKT